MENLIERKSTTLDDYVKNLSDEALNGDFEEIFKHAPLSADALCGIGSCRGRTLQRQDIYFFRKYAIRIISQKNLLKSSLFRTKVKKRFVMSRS